MDKAVRMKFGENQFSMNMSISKIDEQNRMVSGFGTVDALDSQQDIVLAEASQKAFSEFPGNIREMHQPIAAGKMVSFNSAPCWDKASGAIYEGIWVDAYVSTGAESTWQKVLDGTLTGFSIGGEIKDYEMMMGPDGDLIRVIKEYDLIELSLVDRPAQSLAQIVSITKNADGEKVLKGLITEVDTVDVFYCPEDKVAKWTGEDHKCPICREEMTNIGWVESEGGVSEKVAALVNKVYEGEGGVEKVSDETKEAVEVEVDEEIVKEADVVEEETTEEVDETVVEKAEETVEDEGVDGVEGSRGHPGPTRSSGEPTGADGGDGEDGHDWQPGGGTPEHAVERAHDERVDDARRQAPVEAVEGGTDDGGVRSDRPVEEKEPPRAEEGEAHADRDD